MNSNKPSFPVFHYLQRLAQTHVYWVSDAIQSFHLLSSSSLPALNLSHHQGLPMSWHFTSRGQRIGAAALTSVFSMIIQGWFLLGLTDLISLKSNRFSKVFSSTTIWTHQLIVCCSAFFMIQLSHLYMTAGWILLNFDF